ncbi:hypothetical protein CRG98_033953 [Punica granatum]|uniref:Uncharacterized protein n=1 Tax=Punica granatum TaxID=22663 RepID=A0A2I0INT2_PUNGR|nr:hypothetical protein CRG98_033953 [Punica granatum]
MRKIQPMHHLVFWLVSRGVSLQGVLFVMSQIYQSQGLAVLLENVTVLAIFMFRDSVVDPGNNYLKTVACNHLPYGREFMGGNATGRFSDSKILPDLMGFIRPGSPEDSDFRLSASGELAIPKSTQWRTMESMCRTFQWCSEVVQFEAPVNTASPMENTATQVRFAYADFYGALMDIIQSLHEYGFDIADRGCCRTGLVEVSFLSNRWIPGTCSNVSWFLYWDSYHPTERACRIIVQKLIGKLVQDIFQQ